MLKITQYEGDSYSYKRDRSTYYRADYIKLEWETGYIDMRMSVWEKLPKKKKDLILKVG